MSFIQPDLSGEDHGTLSLSQWIHRELRKIKVRDHDVKSLKKDVCIAEVRVPWLLVVSVDHHAVSVVFGDSELLNHHAEQVGITF
ncbi:MAG: hypothetical protein ACLGRW_00600 [Acidobacteriota bacterium]